MDGRFRDDSKYRTIASRRARKITFERLAEGMTLNVIQGHRNCLYSLSIYSGLL